MFKFELKQKIRVTAEGTKGALGEIVSRCEYLDANHNTYQVLHQVVDNTGTHTGHDLRMWNEDVLEADEDYNPDKTAT